MALSDRDEPLIGRAEEQRALSQLLADAQAGFGGALILRGDPGVGKSALARTLRDSARERDLAILAVTGALEERELGFGALGRLLRPVIHRLDQLPEDQRRALSVALGLNTGEQPEFFQIALAVLELLAEVAAERPLLVLIDDGQWLDAPSWEVVAFVARRLELESIALLISLRREPHGEDRLSGIPEREVSPLDRDAARELLQRRSPEASPILQQRLLESSAGNPLALIELPLTAEDVRRDEFLLVDQLPLTQRLEHAFAARLRELNEDLRTFLLVVATDGSEDATLALRATEQITERELELDDLLPAVDLGLISLPPGAVRFRHPLMRSAIYQAAAPARRNQVHRILAQLLAAQPDRAVWHLAATTTGESEAVARELQAAAERALARGATTTAASALSRAARFTPSPADRSRRLLAAAKLGYLLGRRDIVLPLVDGVDTLGLPELDTARLRWIREMLDPAPLASVADVHQLVDGADRARQAGDIELALDLVWLAASRFWWTEPAGDVEGARARILAAAEQIAPVEQHLGVLASVAYSAPLERGSQVVRALPTSLAGSLEELRQAATAAFVTGAFDAAASRLGVAVDAMRFHGELGHLPRLRALQGNVAARAGDWSVADPAIDEGIRLARETGQPLWIAGGEAIQALAVAHRGDFSAAEDLCAAAEARALLMGAGFVLAAIQIARGTAALAAGEPVAAFAHLIRLFSASDPAFHPAMQAWAIGELAAAAAPEERASVSAHVRRFSTITGERPPFWISVGITRARALLAEDAEAEDRFRELLDLDLKRWPLVRAITLLDWGLWLRRQRRSAEARVPLRKALETFEVLRARPWADRTLAELRATGETRRRNQEERRDELTPQELQIAQMAAAGLTNREIGQRLYVSHRTVSAHLYKVFPKLGITSRTQLAGALSEATMSPPTDPSER